MTYVTIANAKPSAALLFNADAAPAFHGGVWSTIRIRAARPAARGSFTLKALRGAVSTGVAVPTRAPARQALAAFDFDKFWSGRRRRTAARGAVVDAHDSRRLANTDTQTHTTTNQHAPSTRKVVDGKTNIIYNHTKLGANTPRLAGRSTKTCRSRGRFDRGRRRRRWSTACPTQSSVST